MVSWFSIQILVNSKIFKLSLNLSLTHLIVQIAHYELKGDLSPVMLKEIFHESCENFKITRICMENHPSMTGWQKLFFQGFWQSARVRSRTIDQKSHYFALFAFSRTLPHFSRLFAKKTHNLQN